MYSKGGANTLRKDRAKWNGGGAPVHMHVMATEIEGDKKLEQDCPSGVCDGEIAQ